MISVVHNWLAVHPNVQTITPERIYRWAEGKNYEPASLLDIDNCLRQHFEKRYCWKVDGVLVDSENSPSEVPPDVEWVADRMGTRVHVEDCEWVPIYRRRSDREENCENYLKDLPDDESGACHLNASLTADERIKQLSSMSELELLAEMADKYRTEEIVRERQNKLYHSEKWREYRQKWMLSIVNNIKPFNVDCR